MSERVHLIGIGGVGMSALAQLLCARGLRVSGSDMQPSPVLARLRAQGAEVAVGHRAAQVEGADRVVISDAIKEDNPELARARELGLRVQRRSEALAELAREYRVIAVSGTHGKTTLTAMLGHILVEAGLRPTVLLGGDYSPFGGNAVVGDSKWMVLEACEAYESFLDLSPEIAVVTNIEPDHLDHHGTEQHLRESFARFLSHLTPSGCAVLCRDRRELLPLAAPLPRPVVWYGREPEAAVRGTEFAAEGLGGRCRLSVDGQDAGEVHIGAPGEHNLVNALGALAAARQAGAPLEAGRRALAAFRGVGRRFEVLGEAAGVVIVDDYAHHPTEIEATLAAARAVYPGRRLVAVFQPHLYSRTRDLAAGFAAALAGADLAVLTDIYPAREAPVPGVTRALIAEPLRRARGQEAVLELEKENVVSHISRQVRPGDVLVMMGAGDIGELARETYRALASRHGKRG